jgi:hypothetical protein
VVAITGSRQSGKTTLARRFFSDLKYVSLEDPSEFAFAQEDPKGFLARFAKGAVFDEAQRWPALFSYLQGMVDEDRSPGRFVPLIFPPHPPDFSCQQINRLENYNKIAPTTKLRIGPSNSTKWDQLNCPDNVWTFGWAR